jgi:hypothetical protein
VLIPQARDQRYNVVADCRFTADASPRQKPAVTPPGASGCHPRGGGGPPTTGISTPIRRRRINGWCNLATKQARAPNHARRPVVP